MTSPHLTSSVRHVIEAASLAPSVHNTQPWRFVVREDGFDLLADPTVYDKLREWLAGADGAGRSNEDTDATRRTNRATHRTSRRQLRRERHLDRQCRQRQRSDDGQHLGRRGQARAAGSLTPRDHRLRCPGR